MNGIIRHRPISFFETNTDILNFLPYLANCRYSSGHRYRYSIIYLPIYLPIF